MVRAEPALGHAPRPLWSADPASSPAHSRRLSALALLALALGVRLALLPSAAHPDLLSVYDRVRLWLEGPATLAEHSLMALPLLLHGLWAKLSGVELPNLSGVPWPAPSEEAVFEQARNLWERTPLATLALWKLPYLVADLAVGWVLSRAVPKRRALGVLALWALHPIALYASGLFAKYEPFMLLPLAGGFLWIARGRLRLGFTLFGLAIAMRLYPALLLPAMLAASAKDARSRLELGALALAPLACVLGACGLSQLGWPPALAWCALPLAAAVAWRLYLHCARRRWELGFLLGCALLALGLLPGVLGALGATRSPLGDLGHHARFLIADAQGGPLSWFALAWGASWLLAGHWARLRGRDSAEAAGRDALDAALLAGLAFYSLAFFHPQYAALLGALVLVRLHRLRDGGPAHGLQLLGVLLLLLGFREGHVSTQLFLPLAPRAVSELPTPLAGLPAGLESWPWVEVGRSLLVLGSAWMLLDLLRTRREEGLQPVEAPLRAGRWALCALAWPVVALAWCASARFAPHDAALGPELELEQAWTPGRGEPLRLRPRLHDLERADHIVVRPGRGPSSVQSGQVELQLERRAARRDEQDQSVELRLPVEELRQADGSWRLPLGELQAQGWRWHELQLSPVTRDAPAVPTRVRFLRTTTKAEVFAAAREEFDERRAGQSWWLVLPALCAAAAIGCGLGALRLRA